MKKEENEYVLTLGEIMLRLKSPSYERLFQSPVLEATFGGGEANVAISLENFGIKSRFVTALPNNRIGDAVISFLRSMNIDTSYVIRQGARLGIYFLEAGSGPRPSMVIYDRAGSSISEAKPRDFDWDSIFQDVRWYHLTGITPALSQSAADLSLESMKFAKKKGITVSLDLNYRKKLWNYGKSAPGVMNELMPLVDIVIANEEDIQRSLGMDLDQKIGGATLSREKYEALARRVIIKYPNVAVVAITLRESYSADNNDWSAMCMSRDDDNAFFSRNYHLTDIVDRVGGGDSFAAGFIYGLYSGMKLADALEFAVAASALKHTIPGDCNRVSVEEVKRLMVGDTSGRVQR
ncbi:MAG: PfkB family carbohydrate kinase [Promethearchaeota archaeon]